MCGKSMLTRAKLHHTTHPTNSKIQNRVADFPNRRQYSARSVIFDSPIATVYNHISAYKRTK